MRKIGIINYKGGTAKTCTAVNIAHGLTLKKQAKVLLVDTDPQGSVASHLGLNSMYSIYDVLLGAEELSSCIINARVGLDVICSNNRLYAAEMVLAKSKKKEMFLTKRLKDVPTYDYVIVDCAPTMNLINQNALLYVDEILVPVSMEYLSLLGVKQLLKNLKILNRIFKKKIIINKVVPTFYDRRNKKSDVIMSSLRRVFPANISTPIRTSVSISEAPAWKQTVFEYAPESNGAEDYYKLIEEVVTLV
tara:strand:+ start:4032 stop:4775 length:744 start_codon:yes stop_codon:yes gene_type:complete